MHALLAEDNISFNRSPQELKPIEEVIDG